MNHRYRMHLSSLVWATFILAAPAALAEFNTGSSAAALLNCEEVASHLQPVLIKQDLDTGLIWNAEPTKAMRWIEAEAYCKSLKTDGKQWRLPTKDEVRLAFNPTNGGRSKYAINPKLSDAMESKLKSFWTSSEHHDDHFTNMSWGFHAETGELRYDYLGNKYPVICVAL